jgi:hypothetical protein
MSDVLIKDFPALTDGQVNDDTKLIPLGIASTGKLYSGTIAQLKLALATQKEKYTATGSEGRVITIGALAGKQILMVAREGSVIYEVDSSPDSLEFVWDSTSITTGVDINAGERFLIIYKS